MDAIFNWSLMIIIFLILFFESFYLFSILDPFLTNNYRWLIIVEKAIINVMLIYITIINLLISIFPLTINFNKILHWIITLYMIGLFVYEMIYSNNKLANLILDYRKESFKLYNIHELFTVKETETRYKEETKIAGQVIATIIIEGEKSFSIRGTNIILIPKFKLSEKEYKYLYNYLNFNFDFINVENISEIPFEFESKTSFYKYIPSYFHVYKYNKNVDKIDNLKVKYFNRILIVIFVASLLIFSLFALINMLSQEFEWIKIIDWFEAISEWLFKSNQL